MQTANHPQPANTVLASPPLDGISLLTDMVMDKLNCSRHQATAKVAAWMGNSQIDVDGKSHVSKWLKSNPDREALEAIAEFIAAGHYSVTDDKPGLRCVNIAELLTTPCPPREMLLAPILPCQGLCMVHATRGIGKTFVALSIGYAVASGGSVLGFKAIRPNRVLLIDGEMPLRAQQERLAALAAGSEHEPPSPDYLKIITPDLQPGAMPNLATHEGQQAIEPYLDGVALVIIDNLATLARHGRSNDEESWTPVQNWLLDLRRRGISVLVVHHGGKNGEQRGTSAKEDVLDTVIKLKRPADYKTEQGARFEVHFTKARGLCGEEARPFEAQLVNKDGALIWVTKSIEDAELEQLRTLFNEGYSIREAAQEMGLSAGKVQRLKKKMQGLDASISSSTAIS